MTAKKKIKLAIVEDHNLFRETLSYVVQHHLDWKDIVLSFEAANGKELIEKLKTRKPDVILMGLKMPEMDGLKATMYVKRHYPGIKVLILTKYKQKKFIIESMKRGANGYLLKTDSLLEIRKAVATIVTSDYYYTKYLTEAIVRGWAGNTNTKQMLGFRESLTRRELEVLKLICLGCSSPEIAKKFNRSPRTIEGYRKELLGKLGVKNVVGLVTYAYLNDFIEPDFKMCLT